MWLVLVVLGGAPAQRDYPHITRSLHHGTCLVQHRFSGAGFGSLGPRHATPFMSKMEEDKFEEYLNAAWLAFRKQLIEAREER